MSPKVKPRNKIETPVDDLSFEAAFAELEEIVQQMEAGQLSLDESLALFERGRALAERCGRLLENAELRVRQLVDGRLDEIEAEVED